MASVGDIYPLWLKADNLPDGGGNVTIERAEVRILHPRPTEEKPALVLTFKGKSRRLILNDGNANRLANLLGEDYTTWTGRIIHLAPEQRTKAQKTIIAGAPKKNNGGAAQGQGQQGPAAGQPLEPQQEPGASDPVPLPVETLPVDDTEDIPF